MVLFDHGYPDYDRWMELTRPGVDFVTGLMDDASCRVVESRPAPGCFGSLRERSRWARSMFGFLMSRSSERLIQTWAEPGPGFRG